MKMSDLTLKQCLRSQDSLKKLRDTLASPKTATPNPFIEDLDVALTLLEAKITDDQKKEKCPKFYCPIWVSILLQRIVSKDNPLSTAETKLFKEKVSQLEFKDFKPARNEIFGYVPMFVTPQEISETIWVLKRHFGLV